LCISNGGQSAKYVTNMYKINGSANIKVSAEKPATAHTRDRWHEKLNKNALLRLLKNTRIIIWD